MYTREEIFKKAKKAIEENNLFFIRDVVAFLPCSKTTFYELFDVSKSDTSDTYKDEMFAELAEMLEKNKIKTKAGIRCMLYQSNTPNGLMMLYRMICTPEERREVNQSYIDHTSNGDSISEEKKRYFEENFGMGIKK